MPFLRTLRRFPYVTQDQRYLDLHRDVMRRGLIGANKGKWSRYGTVLEQPDTRFVCEMIEQSIAAGVSEREALAEAAVELNIKAASFGAAVERLRALLHEHRKTVSEKPG